MQMGEPTASTSSDSEKWTILYKAFLKQFETSNLTEPLNHPSGKPPDNKKSDPLGQEKRKRQTKNTRSHPYASKTGRDSTSVEDLEVRNHYLESTMGKDGNPIADFPPSTHLVK
jgi:hypothetical protein